MGRQPSSIKQRLPKAIFDELKALLQEGRVTQKEVLERVNAMLEDAGVPERITRSSLNRYAQRIESKIARMREAREVAEVWAGKLGTAPEGELGRLLIESIRNTVFEVHLKLDDLVADGGLDPEKLPEVVNVLKNVALTAQRLEASATLNAKREREVRKQALEDAANAVEEAAVQRGLNAEDAAFWRQKVLGVQ